MLTLFHRLKIWILCIALLLPEWGLAQTGSAPWTVAGRKAELKRQSRWSLDQWLATRERMRWMDMWLALNSPSPYEFFVSGGYHLTPQSRGGKAGFRYGAGAYVSIFGLEYEHDQIFEPENHARFHFRIFGYNVQNTNLTLQAGIRFRSEPVSFRQAYLGVSTSIYLHRYFGIYSLYRYYLASVSVPVYGTAKGHRFEVGPFLDFGPFRIFGNYVYQADRDESVSYSAVANGWHLGGQLFF